MILKTIVLLLFVTLPLASSRRCYYACNCDDCESITEQKCPNSDDICYTIVTSGDVTKGCLSRDLTSSVCDKEHSCSICDGDYCNSSTKHLLALPSLVMVTFALKTFF